MKSSFFLLPVLVLLCGNAAGVDYDCFQNRNTPPRLHEAAKRTQTLNFSDSGNWSVTVPPGGHPLAELLFPKPLLPPEGKTLEPSG